MNTLALSQHTALIVGCGDVGLRIARQLQNAGATVTGIVRRDAAAIQLREAGVTPHRLDLDAETAGAL